MPPWLIGAVVAVLVVGLLFFLMRRGNEDSPKAAEKDRGRDEAGKKAAEPADEDEATSSIDIDVSTEPEAIGVVQAHGEIDLDVELEEDVAFDDDEPTGPVARILVWGVGHTDRGKRRKHNEDAFAVIENQIFAIADGMGGYAAGEVASQMAVDTISKSFEARDFEEHQDRTIPRRGDELVQSIRRANRAIYQQAQENEKQAGMGTTLVAARFSPNKKRVYIANVGDSRCYRLRGESLLQLTTDHTLASLGITGPNGAKLIRALGVQSEVDVDLHVEEPHGGDHFLLCSDGLSKMVPEPHIVEIIRKAEGLEEAVNELIAEANERGGRDNVSAILVRVDDVDSAEALGRA